MSIASKGQSWPPVLPQGLVEVDKQRCALRMELAQLHSKIEDGPSVSRFGLGQDVENGTGWDM